MILLPEFLLPVGRMAAEIAVNQLWQGVVVAAGLALCLRLAPRTRASHRFALWMAAFVLVAALPLAPWFMGLIAASNAPVPTLHDAASMASAAWFQLDQRWTLAVLLVWALLAGYRLVMLVAGAARARRIWKNAIPLPALSQLLTVKSSEASSLPVQLTTLSLWARRSVEICQSPDLDRPSVIGFWRPRILLPDWLIGKLTDAELRQIVLHELEHLRRFDDWTNLFLKIASALLALNPALVWMDRQLEREREMATDEAVVRRTRAPRAYAACLASVAERRMEMKLGQSVAFELAAWRRRPELAERILSLLRTRETIGPVGRTALAGALATGMLVAVVLLARAPQLVAFQAANRPELAAEAQLVPVAAVPVALQPSKAKTRGKSHPVRQAEQPAAEDALNLQPAMEPELAELQTTADEAGTSGWVVLAVFEERVTAAGQNGLRADFDQAQASVEQKATPEARHRTRAAERRLILHLLPVHQGWVALEL